MSLFLLVLGAVTAAAGFGLVVSGVSFQEHVYDTSVLTPGVVAIVGGFFLIGLAQAVRVLQQIEMTLAGHPMVPAGQPEDAPPESGDEAGPAKLPLPTEPETAPVTAPAEAITLARLREKFPSLVRVEGVPVGDESDVPLLPKVAARADEAGEEIKLNGKIEAKARARAEAKGGLTIRVLPRQVAAGGAPVRAARRLEAVSPSEGEKPKTSMFESFWPKGPSADREEPAAADYVEPAPAPVVIAAEAAAEPSISPPLVDYAPAAQQRPPRPRLSILKSGVVDGMAYTLYSDGSIEAQLPQGTLRFGSITELRNHIEQSA
jgi:hypothetical protein